MHRQIIMLATKNRVAMAQLIRDFLEDGIERTRKHQLNDLANLTKLNITGGPTDLSERLDDYLYGIKQ